MEFYLNTSHIGITCDSGNGKVLSSALKLQQCVEVDGKYSQIKPTAITTALKHISVYFRCTRVYFKLYNGIIQQKVYVHIAFRKYSFFPHYVTLQPHTKMEYIYLFSVQNTKKSSRIKSVNRLINYKAEILHLHR